jgi:SET domain-containing protein
MMGGRKRKPRTSSREPVKVSGSGVHGRGVFATRPIRKGERIIEYTGARVSWEKAQRLPPKDPNNPHHTAFFGLEDGNVINPALGGNEAQWINHSCDPNCETREENGRVFVFASRDLKRGSELFFDYQLEPAGRRTKTLEVLFKCYCDTPKCRGTMLEPLAD